MRNFFLIILGIFSLSLSINVNAKITEEGTGILYGDSHQFSATAPKDWVLDTHNGVKQGLHMLFYLQGENWADSSVIVYGRYVPTREIPSVEQQVQRVVTDFQTHGHPDYHAEKKPTIVLDNKKKVDIYFYSGDKWGNLEAVAYIKEKNSINFLVFNAKTKADFDKNLAGFYSIVRSYKNMAE